MPSDILTNASIVEQFSECVSRVSPRIIEDEEDFVFGSSLRERLKAKSSSAWTTLTTFYPHRIKKLVGLDATFPYWHPDGLFEMALESAHSLYAKFSLDYLNKTLPPPKEYTLKRFFQAVSLLVSIFVAQTDAPGKQALNCCHLELRMIFTNISHETTKPTERIEFDS